MLVPCEPFILWLQLLLRTALSAVFRGVDSIGLGLKYCPFDLYTAT